MRIYRTKDEALGLCDYSRAKRTDPRKPLHKMPQPEQRGFWRKVPLLDLWRGTWRESRR